MTTASGLFVRRDIWALEEQQPWHPIIEAYAIGIAAMQQRAAGDPTSWTYQAAVHAVPVGGRGDRFRDQCQHGSWFFLPWHRMYLYWFERIVRAAIAASPDVPDEVKASWALPYWRYGRGGKYASLPPCFREPMHNGSPNPLYVQQRARRINAGGSLPLQTVSAAQAMKKQLYARKAVAGLTAGFGGPITGWNHDPNVAFGALEQTPHNDVHVGVGGPEGYMSAFDTAPLDPVFWLHHANIDRLWAVWLKRPHRHNPTSTAWRTHVFHFHDEHGNDVQAKPAAVADTAALGYTYDPAPAPPPASPTAAAEARDVTPPPPEHPPELVGATQRPVILAGEPVTVALTVSEPTSPQLRAAAPSERRFYLNVEGITGERNPGISYGVYLDAPRGAAPPPADDPRHVGNVSFFGIERVGDVRQEHADAPGLRHVFNVGDAVHALRRSGAWHERRLTVTFFPLRPSAGDALDTEEEAVPPVTVGRVALYLQ